MIKAKEATVLAWPMLRTSDGCPAVAECQFEKRYLTNFVPPRMPQTLSGIPEAKRPPGHRPFAHDALPPAVETRNIGVTLEVQPRVLEDGKRVYLDLRSQWSDLVELKMWGNVLTALGTVVQVPEPLFSDTKSRLDLNLRSGERQLIAVHNLAKPANGYELDLIRVVVTKVRAEEDVPN
ncbi:MAG: hypothetical protein WDN28_12015 [Chthoniobacter sp.]